MGESTVPSTPPMFPGEVFAHTADFDIGIRQLLPRYDEILDTLVFCLPKTSQYILELGCGTGELSLKLLQQFPSARVVAVDYSPRMLSYAQSKINAAGYADRWTAIQADFGEWADKKEATTIGNSFDACVSSLAIHHLKDEMKLKLFHRIRESLNPGGAFWNADPILPESEFLGQVYLAARENWARQEGTTLAKIRAKIGKTTTYGYSNPDQLATLEAHLEMLEQAGFNTLAVPWKYFGLAVFGGLV